MVVTRFVVSLVMAAALVGCAKPPQQNALSVATGPQLVDASMSTGAIMQVAAAGPLQALPPRIFSSGHLAGRTLAVASAADIMLKRGEVILTFDDGPRPGRTDAILATLDQFDVKATFLMLGQAAQSHPLTAQKVALAGHTIGSHTYDHADLSTMTPQAAMDDIARGQAAIVKALAPIGKSPAPFFRFPYLAQTGFLRTSLSRDSAVVLDVNIDSKDYYKDTPEQVVDRTLARLDARGSGIILFHDIQARTMLVLPQFLAALEQRGYSAVRLVPRDNGPFGTDIVTAEAPVDLRGSL